MTLCLFSNLSGIHLPLLWKFSYWIIRCVELDGIYVMKPYYRVYISTDIIFVSEFTRYLDYSLCKRGGFPDSSVGKESTSNAGDLGSIPGLERSPGEGIGCLLQYSWAALVALLVKNLPAMLEALVWSLGWEGPLEKGKATHSSILVWRIPWTIQTMVLQRVGHDWATFTLPKRKTCLFFFFFNSLSFKVFDWVCYNIASILCFDFWSLGTLDLSSTTRDETHTPCVRRQSLNHWTTREIRKTCFFKKNSFKFKLCSNY